MNSLPDVAQGRESCLDESLTNVSVSIEINLPVINVVAVRTHCKHRTHRRTFQELVDLAEARRIFTTLSSFRIVDGALLANWTSEQVKCYLEENDIPCSG